MSEISVQAVVEEVRRGRDDFTSICRALGVDPCGAKMRVVDRALQKARRAGHIRFVRARGAWVTTLLALVLVGVGGCGQPDDSSWSRAHSLTRTADALERIAAALDACEFVALDTTPPSRAKVCRAAGGCSVSFERGIFDADDTIPAFDACALETAPTLRCDDATRRVYWDLDENAMKSAGEPFVDLSEEFTALLCDHHEVGE